LTGDFRIAGKGELAMQQLGNTPFGQAMEARPERPPNYIVRAIIFLLILSPLCLLFGGSSLFTAWTILTGPPVRSEIPVSMRALMELIRFVVALIGFFVPIIAMIQALKVYTEFDAGNYGGAAKASKAAANYCRQSLILLVLILIIMTFDLLRYFASLKD
jgi:hypothetical protein